MCYWVKKKIPTFLRESLKNPPPIQTRLLFELEKREFFLLLLAHARRKKTVTFNPKNVFRFREHNPHMCVPPPLRFRFFSLFSGGLRFHGK